MAFDPFGGLSRGISSGLTSLMQIEQMQRQKESEKRRNKLLDMQLSEREEATSALSGLDISPRAFVQPGPENVGYGAAPSALEGESIDVLNMMRGKGVDFRAPETIQEMGLKPAQAMAISHIYPRAMADLGVKTPAAAAEERRVRGAQARIKQRLSGPVPSNPEQFGNWIGALSADMIDLPNAPPGLLENVKFLREIHAEDPKAVTQMTSTYWQGRNAALSSGKTLDESHAIGEQRVAELQPRIKPDTFNKTMSVIQRFKPDTKPQGAGSNNEMRANRIRDLKASGKPVAEYDQNWLKDYDARELEIHNANVTAKKNQSEAALKRVEISLATAKSKAKDLDAFAQSYESKMASGKLTEKDREASMAHWTLEISRLIDIRKDQPEETQRHYDNMISIAQSKLQALIRHKVGDPSLSTPTPPGSAPKTAAEFLKGKGW